MQKNRGYKRRQLLVYPKLQLNFIYFCLALSLFTIAVFFGQYRFMLMELTDISNANPHDEVIKIMINESSERLAFSYVICALVVLVVAAWGGLILSFRAAGPMVRLKNHLAAIEGGKKPGKLRFRDGDYFDDVADAFNKAFPD